MSSDTITDFWDNAMDVFGRNVSSPSHPMYKAYMIYLEMMRDMQTDDESEDECLAHPPYYCDGGCGKIMGTDDECKRICADCKAD